MKLLVPTNPLYARNRGLLALSRFNQMEWAWFLFDVNMLRHISRAYGYDERSFTKMYFCKSGRLPSQLWQRMDVDFLETRLFHNMAMR